MPGSPIPTAIALATGLRRHLGSPQPPTAAIWRGRWAPSHRLAIASTLRLTFLCL